MQFDSHRPLQQNYLDMFHAAAAAPFGSKWNCFLDLFHWNFAGVQQIYSRKFALSRGGADGFQRESELARSKPRHLAPQPKASFAAEMFRRALLRRTFSPLPRPPLQPP